MHETMQTFTPGQAYNGRAVGQSHKMTKSHNHTTAIVMVVPKDSYVTKTCSKNNLPCCGGTQVESHQVWSRASGHSRVDTCGKVAGPA